MATPSQESHEKRDGELETELAVFMAALWNTAGHYIFILWFLLLSFFLT